MSAEFLNGMNPIIPKAARRRPDLLRQERRMVATANSEMEFLIKPAQNSSRFALWVNQFVTY